MPHGLHGDRTLMRIFLAETDRCPEGPYEGKPLYEAILLTLRDHGCAGATVVRAIAGYGSSHRIHTDKVLRLTSDLPVIVEVVDDETELQAVLPKLDGMIGSGMITMERAHVIMYRENEASAAARDD